MFAHQKSGIIDKSDDSLKKKCQFLKKNLSCSIIRSSIISKSHDLSWTRINPRVDDEWVLREIKDNKKITRRYNEKLWEFCVSISTQTTFFRYVLEAPRTRRIRNTYNLSYERYGATIKVFTVSSSLVDVTCDRG